VAKEDLEDHPEEVSALEDQDMVPAAKEDLEDHLEEVSAPEDLPDSVPVDLEAPGMVPADLEDLPDTAVKDSGISTSCDSRHCSIRRSL
jgi:hypothetical protein